MRNHGCGGLPRTLRWVLWVSLLLGSSAFAADTQPPSVPTNPTAVASSSTGIIVNWNASTDDVGVTGYEVQLCQGSGCNSSFTLYSSASAGRAITGLTASTTYGYRVRAKDAVPNYSAYTSMVYVTTPAAGDTQAPTTPTGFTAVASSSTGVVLNWNNSTDNVEVTGYQVERCQGSGCTSSFTQFDITPPAGWVNTGLTPSTTYGYRLRARDAVPNYSAFTSIVYVTTPAADTQPPSVPTNPTATASSSTGIIVNWNASTDNVGVTGYEVQLCQGSGCNSSFTLYGSASAGRAITGLTASTTYGYRVRAKDAVPNYSAYTSMVYVTTPAAGDTQAPTAPTGFTATASSSTGVVLNWIDSTDNVEVTGYQVERCQGSGCTSSFTQFDITPPSGWANTGLTPSTTYGYRVRARDAVPNYSAFTSIVYVTTLSTDTTAPSVPTNFTATASSSTSVVMNWTASTDNVAVTGYQLERCQGSGCNSSFTAFDLSSAGWTNTGLTASTTYGYRVRAKDAVPNYSAFTSIVYVTTQSAGDTQAPTTPTGLKATASSSTGVVLSWAASTDNVAVTGYQVERCQGSGCTSSFTQFNISPSGGWANTGLTPSTTYGYRVRARDAIPNYSAFTSIVYVTTPASGDTTAPSVPTNFAASASSSTDAVLNWTASTDNVEVTGYQIERCQGTNCNSSFTQFTAVSTNWANTGLLASSTYGYRVRAMDAVPNYSAFTGIVYVTTQAASTDTQAPTVPSNVSVTVNSSSQVTVRWTASTDNAAVAGYQLERCTGTSCNSSFSQFNVTSTSYADTGRSGSTTYGYRVRARDAAPNYSAFSGIVYATTPASSDTQVPTAPSGLTVTASGNEVTLAWHAATDNVGITEYLVERCEGSGCPYAQIASVTTTSYTDRNLTTGVYRYRVRARDAASNFSVYSNAVIEAVGTPEAELGNAVSYEYDRAGRLRRADHPDGKQIAYTLDAAGNRNEVQNEVPPAAPQTINVPTTSGNGTYTISWVGPAEGTVTSYQLDEATNSSFTGATSVSVTTASRLIENKADDNYWYRVRACFQSVCGPFLEGDNSILVRNPPGIPGAFNVPSLTYESTYRLQWSPATTGTITRYELYEANNGQENRIYNASYPPNGVPVAHSIGEYTYRVRACNEISCGPFRNASNSLTFARPAITLDNVSINGWSILGGGNVGFAYSLTPQGDVSVQIEGSDVNISRQGPARTSWLDPKVAMSQYQARATTNCDQRYRMGVWGTWLPMGPHTTWGISIYNYDTYAYCTITVEISAVSDPGTVLDSAVIDVGLYVEQY